MPAYVPAFIGLGSNLGDREQTIRSAADALGALPKTRLLRLSSLMETPAQDSPPGSPSFLNAVAKLETKLTPAELLAALLQTEAKFGRVRKEGVRNAPRTLDLDLLLYGEQIIDTPDLVVPHPRMHQRLFVLWPLLQIDSRVKDPRTGAPWADAYEKLKELP